MPHKFDISGIITILEGVPLVSKVEILLVDEIERRGFYKIRCSLIPSKFKLDIKFIKTEKEFLYSYQLHFQKAIARWDNEPHYPDLDNSPHHYHHGSKVISSALSGNPGEDLKEVFLKIAELLSGKDS